jgi:translation initiation factor 2B subunit (eIF-2B alpha/beta/delta family)
VGADTILADGSLINGTSTYRLAQAASLANIPFYCICETAKFDYQNPDRKQPELEPGFELILSSLITAIITETGMIKPSDVANYIPMY